MEVLAKFSMFFSCLLLHSSVSGNPTLISNFIGVICPEVEITLTCSITGEVLVWTVIGTSSSRPYTTTINAPQDLSSRQLDVEDVAVFTASVTSSSPNLISTLSTTATSRLDGVRVECLDFNTVLSNETTLHIVTPPSMPQNLRITSTQNETETSLVTLQWGPPSDNGGDEVDSYNLTVSGGISRSVITDTTASIKLSYNVDHTVRVSATNCAGSGTEAVEGPFTLTRVDCSSPVAVNGVVIEPYASMTEGSVIHYQCGETFVPNTRVKARCGSDGTWSPDPRQHNCQLVDCGVPQLPENSSLINNTGTLKGQEVTFQCNIGPDPQVITAVCTSVSGGSKGVWSPDPELVVCGVNCTRPKAPDNGLLGEVTLNTAQFGCKEGYSPQGTMTAVCVATDTWSPDPVQLECTAVIATSIMMVMPVVVDCGSPQPPVNGMLTGINTNTMEGSEVTFQCNATAVCSRDGRWSPDPGQQVCGFQSDKLTTAASIAVICSVVFYIGGVVSGLLIYLAITRCKETRKQVAITSSGRSEAPNKTAPVYEDIVLTPAREQAGIELQGNVAYGPLKK